MSETKKTALVEATSLEAAADGLELYAEVDQSSWVEPIRRSTGLVLKRPIFWSSFFALSMGYHALARWLVTQNLVAQGILFPTLVTPVSQGFHVGLLMLAVSAAYQTLRTGQGPGWGELLRREGGRALTMAGLFTALGIGIRLLLGYGPSAGGAMLLLPMLWIFLHVASEAIFFDLSVFPAFSRGLLRAGRRLVRAPLGWVRSRSWVRTFQALAAMAGYPLVSLLWSLLPASVPEILSTLLFGLAGSVHVLTWTHLEWSLRLEEGQDEAGRLPSGESEPSSPAALPPGESSPGSRG